MRVKGTWLALLLVLWSLLLAGCTGGTQPAVDLGQVEIGQFRTEWCAPRQVDREIIYTLRMKFLPTNHTEQIQVFMRPAGSHGPP